MDCEHPVQLYGLCAICGKDVSAKLNLWEKLIVCSDEETNEGQNEAERIEKETQQRLLSARKLSLVVDLDQTVLHATIDPAMGKLAGLEIYPVVLPESPDQTYYIKLRPHLREFMMSMASLFELHVYTMGSRSYARTVVALFDPDGRLFYDRILSREDSGISEQRKDLKRIFPADDSSVLVIDDRADIWNYSRNLIPVPPCTTTPSLLLTEDDSGIEGRTDAVVTNDSDNELPLIQAILESIHGEFFQRLNGGRKADVKEIVDERRKSVLSGVSLVFSGVIPLGIPPSHFEMWRLAETFGAECQIQIKENTTHLISLRNDTDKVINAVEAGIVVVRPEWLFECIKQWRRIPYETFLVADLPMRETHSLEFDPDELRAMREELDELEDSGADASDFGVDASDFGADASNFGADASNFGADASNSGADASNFGDSENIDLEEGPKRKRMRMGSESDTSLIEELENELL